MDSCCSLVPSEACACLAACGEAAATSSVAPRCGVAGTSGQAVDVDGAHSGQKSDRRGIAVDTILEHRIGGCQGGDSGPQRWYSRVALQHQGGKHYRLRRPQRQRAHRP